METLKSKYNLTDLGNAARYAHLFDTDLRYCSEAAEWRVYEGSKWATFADERALMRTQNIVNLIKFQASGLPDNEAIELLKWADDSSHVARLKATLQLAKAHPSLLTSVTDYDPVGWYFAVRNGMLNLETGQLEEHDPLNLITRASHVTYDSTATCPLWYSFLDDVFESNAELITYVQKCVGYSLTPHTMQKVFFFLHGRQGNNGKTTFMDTIRHMMGDYATLTPEGTIMRKDTGGLLDPKNDLAALAGVRMVLIPEISKDSKINDGLVKTLTGGDAISCRFLYKEWFTMKPQFKIWMNGNNLPDVSDLSDAYWSRVKIIPFNRTFQEGERDWALGEKLLGELPGILNWALEGVRLMLDTGLNTPRSVQREVNAYRAVSDTVSTFIEEHCDVGPEYTTPQRPLYDKYKEYMEERGDKPAVTRLPFYDALGVKGHYGDRVNGKVGYVRKGLRLRG